MRILTGKYKGRIIKMPKGIRPTQDKVRKALFDILGDIEGLSFLELFAGSGAVGIEALSRGAKGVVFVEKNQQCIDNIKISGSLMGLLGHKVMGLDVQEAIKRLSKAGETFDIIFLDPPYYKGGANPVTDKASKMPDGRLWLPAPLETTAVCDNLSLTGPVCNGAKKILQILGGYDILAPCGFIIAQHFKKDILPKEAGYLRLFRESRYADTILSFYKKKVHRVY